MMSLLNPTPGEVLDRLTILDLKIEAAERVQKQELVIHWKAEKVSLEERLVVFGKMMSTQTGEIKEKIDLHINSLVALNSLLWRAEDNIRELPETAVFRLASLCKKVASWNDGRNRNIQDLNKLYGFDQEEKIYKNE